MIEQLNFSYNWNKKLDCKMFTTLRLSNRFSVGDKVFVTLKNIEHCNAICRGKKKLFMKDINEFIAGIDTGYSVEECQDILKKMYSTVDWNTQEIFLYLFEKVKEEQGELQL